MVSKFRVSHIPIEKLIRSSYLTLGVLLVTVVILWIHFFSTPGYEVSREYKQLEERAVQLETVRKFINQGSTAIRDYLINNNQNNASVYDDEIRRAKAGTYHAMRALNDWVPEKFVLAQMDRDIADFWLLLDENRPGTIEAKESRGYTLVHDQVLPGRQEIFNSLKLLDDRNALDRATIVQIHAKLRRNDLAAIFITMAVVIGISLLLASGNQRFRRNFQAESLRKYKEMALARDGLEQLSGRLLRIQEEERRKISRELHDGIGQTLTALRMEIHQVHFSAAGVLRGGSSNGEERLLRARKLAEEAVSTIKDISLLLRPPLLDDLGLEPALGWLIEQFQRRTGIRCRFRTSELHEHLPDEIKTCAFRVVQEALNNCEKHAAPVTVEVVVNQEPDALSICIQDDGVGFLLTENNTPAMQAGLGILGMRERAVLLGGSMSIESAPGKGTKLSMSLPIVRLNSIPHILEFPGPPTALIA